ncbi:hypothetical protein CYMTET_45043 [Cymbomonas tetramitiformis]|uniref:Uncharacterized protein n=1 Tax=Cymbomonas tetramitiformis TaxID=36881 RepID=A0AAE0C0U0_9CHLO|nr:hypothetical protein CYMTET_45043 [Cymbomonas tetramitiformis]
MWPIKHPLARGMPISHYQTSEETQDETVKSCECDDEEAVAPLDFGRLQLTQLQNSAVPLKFESATEGLCASSTPSVQGASAPRANPKYVTRFDPTSPFARVRITKADARQALRSFWRQLTTPFYVQPKSRRGVVQVRWEWGFQLSLTLRMSRQDRQRRLLASTGTIVRADGSADGSTKRRASSRVRFDLLAPCCSENCCW